MVNILLIGDSLTEGYYSHGMRFHSYAEKLEELLYATFPRISHSDGDESRPNKMELPFLIHQRGVSGECTDDIAMRLHNYLKKATDKGPDSLYDIVCVLGGTNDIGHELSPDSICDQLGQMYDMIRKHNPNALLVPITMPEARFTDEDYVQRRREVNTWILSYGQNDSKVIHVDLERLLPHFKVDKTVDDAHWDDHLHMTVKGYDRFAELVFEAIKTHIPSYMTKN